MAERTCDRRRTAIVWALILFAGVSGEAGSNIQVSGTVGKSLTVKCIYPANRIRHRQYWCRGTGWIFCSILVQSKGSEKKVKKGRFSIEDSHKTHTFSVTMDKLTLEDSGVYWCGTEQTGFDEMYQVTISVSTSGPNLVPPTMSSSAKASPPPSSSSSPITASSRPCHATEVIRATQVPCSTPVSGDDEAGQSAPVPGMLLPSLGTAALIGLLLLAVVVVWVMLRRRNKALIGAGAQKDAGISLSNLPPLERMENPLYVVDKVHPAAKQAPLYSVIEFVPVSAVFEHYYEEIQQL